MLPCSRASAARSNCSRGSIYWPAAPPTQDTAIRSNLSPCAQKNTTRENRKLEQCNSHLHVYFHTHIYIYIYIHVYIYIERERSDCIYVFADAMVVSVSGPWPCSCYVRDLIEIRTIHNNTRQTIKPIYKYIAKQINTYETCAQDHVLHDIHIYMYIYIIYPPTLSDSRVWDTLFINISTYRPNVLQG